MRINRQLARVTSTSGLAIWTAGPGWARLPGPRGRATWTAGPEGWAPGVLEPVFVSQDFSPPVLLDALSQRSADIGESVVVLGQQRLKNSLKMLVQRREEYLPVHFALPAPWPTCYHASLNIKQHLRMATDAHEFRVLWTVWICHKNFELSRATQEISTSDLFW